MSRKKRSTKKQRNADAKPADSSTASAEQPSGLLTAGIFHIFPAILAGLMLVRTFVDGIVYPHWNPGITFVMTGLFIAWGAWGLWRDQPLRAPLLTALFAAFLVWSVLITPQSIQLDNTFHMLPVWAACFFAFMIGANAMGSQRNQGWLFAMFLLAVGAEALYSILHLYFILPRARLEVNQNPELVQRFFGAAEMTADIRHRLESNRAFGSFLFANALAGFMALGLPIAVGVAVDRVSALRAGLAGGAFTPVKPNMAKKDGEPDTLMLLALFQGLAITVLAAIGIWFLILILTTADVTGQGVLNSTAAFALLVGVVPMALGIVTWWLTRRYGPRATGLALAGVLSPVAALLCAWAMYLTESRGGFIALFAATALTLALCFGGRFFKTAAVATLVGIGVWISFGGGESAWAQNPPPPSQGIAVEGIAESRPAITDVSTFKLRLDYWDVGIRMAFDNPGAGVGLGNFGVAYPKYQIPGQPDVKMAHNDYLQMLCETGFVGGALFTGFWVAFAVLGAWVLLKRRDDRWILGGLYAGVMAFAAHQFVDFGMQNSTLSTWAYLMAGFFCVRAGLSKWARPRALRLVAFALLLVVGAFAAGGALRLRQADQDFQSLGDLPAVLDAGRFLMLSTQQPAQPQGAKWALPAPLVLALVDNSKALEAMGWFQAVMPGQTRPQRIPVSPMMPADAQFIVEYPDRAYTIGLEYAKRHLEEAKAVDAAYPYRPDLAAHICFMHELLLNVMTGEDRVEHARASVRWAEILVERSPWLGWHHMWLGKSLWYLGSIVEGEEGLAYLDRGIEAYRQATLLQPSSPDLLLEYAAKLEDLAALMERLGNHERAESLRAQAGEARAQAEQVQAAKA